MFTTRRTLVRRLAPVLAAVQLAAVALAPALEALFERSPGPASVEAGHRGCAVVHQPATCPSCAMTTVRARAPERVQLAFAGVESVVAEAPMPARGPARTAPTAVRTRAPPAHAV
jgi:hypothetical protein